MNMKLYLGNNLEKLKELEDNSVDSVLSDPPYGINFMGKKWDYDVPSVELWKEVLRVLKPGGHVLSFCGTRTYHRMVVNMEDAGFEIRDTISWLYGNGFPKSLNIGKEYDKKMGNDREVVGERIVDDIRGGNFINDEHKKIKIEFTKGSSQYEGWGTGLKPSQEFICMARKPICEKTITENMIKWGVGGINIDESRVGYGTGEGRFPSNTILECICDEVIKGEKGEIKHSGGQLDNTDLTHEWGYKEIKRTNFTDKGDIHTNPNCPCYILDKQSGGASRFFYVAKVSKKERNMGLDGFEEKEQLIHNKFNSRDENGNKIRKDGSIIPPLLSKNQHPTVKPINLLYYLVNMITPKGGVVMDMYMGSGTTGIAARLLGNDFIGMEIDENYFKIAEQRINSFEEYRKLLKDK